MKRFLFILAILGGLLMLSQQEETYSSMIEENIETQQNLQLERNEMSDYEHQAFIISKELKGSNCLTPRRTATSVSHIIHLRSVKTLYKMTTFLRIKGINQLKKTFEKVNICQTINFTSLLSHDGYFVFGLRKLII